MTRAIIGGVGLGKQLGVVFIPFIFPPHFSFSFSILLSSYFLLHLIPLELRVYPFYLSKFESCVVLFNEKRTETVQ